MTSAMTEHHRATEIRALIEDPTARWLDGSRIQPELHCVEFAGII